MFVGKFSQLTKTLVFSHLKQQWSTSLGWGSAPCMDRSVPRGTSWREKNVTWWKSLHRMPHRHFLHADSLIPSHHTLKKSSKSAGFPGQLMAVRTSFHIRKQCPYGETVDAETVSRVGNSTETLTFLHIRPYTF